MRGTPEHRFWAKVEKGDSCWLWIASKRHGYGQFHLRRSKTVYAHRFAYEQIVGPIPPGLTLDHLCREPGCVNPEHLEPVTIGDNVRRGERSQRTHCPHGHEYTPENIKRSVNGTRGCRTCQRKRMLERYHERRREALAAGGDPA